LYRRHTIPTKNSYIKDLSKLGRDLNRTLIVDNVKENFCLQPENGLHISNFLGDEKDNELRKLSKDLKSNINI
jgi:CTD small phosphatase-like protein 2